MRGEGGGGEESTETYMSPSAVTEVAPASGGGVGVGAVAGRGRGADKPFGGGEVGGEVGGWGVGSASHERSVSLTG